jgi:hypothetical protein
LYSRKTYGTTSVIPQLAKVWFDKLQERHFTSLWVWSSSCISLRSRHPCTHFQQILAKIKIHFWGGYFSTTECYYYKNIQYQQIKQVKKVICPLVHPPTEQLREIVPYTDAAHVPAVFFNNSNFMSSHILNKKAVS